MKLRTEFHADSRSDTQRVRRINTADADVPVGHAIGTQVQNDSTRSSTQKHMKERARETDFNQGLANFNFTLKRELWSNFHQFQI